MFLKISKCIAGSWCCVLEFCFTVLYSFCKTGMAESYNQLVLISSTVLYHLVNSIILKQILVFG